MKRWFLSLFVALVLATHVFAQVDIDSKNRVENFGPGYCAWCSIETLGRHHGIKKLFDLAKNRSKESDVRQWDGTQWVPQPYVVVEYGPGQYVQEKRNVGTDYGVYRKLNSLGVKYRMQWSGDYSHKLIQYAVKNKLGCCFAVRATAFGPKSSAHAMVLTNFDDKNIECIDPNDPASVYVYSREWFDRYWTGWILVIEKNQETAK